MLAFLEKLFGGHGSKKIAKQRLQLVLIHDRSDISPALMESLRRDIIEVIMRYMDVDEKNIEMQFGHGDGQVALEASIPIIRLKRGTQINGVPAQMPKENVPITANGQAQKAPASDKENLHSVHNNAFSNNQKRKK